MTIIKDYFTLTKKHKEQYGESTIVLIQVGTFFEVYGLRGENGQYIGSDIEKFTTMNDLVMAKKQITMADKDGVVRDVMQAGFHIDHSEKYINRLQNKGYTIVIYTQDIQAKNTSRSLTEVISPGTFFTPETTKLTNHVMCVWIHKSKARKMLSEQLTIGTAVLDVLTGYISSSQFHRDFYHTPCTYDELERIVSIYNPSECIVISNMSKKIVDEIVVFSSITSKKLHIISELTEECDTNNANYKTQSNVTFKTKINCGATIDFRTYAQNAEKQTYQLATIEKFYPAILHEEIIDLFPTHLIAIQSLTFILNFVHQHCPNLVNKLQPPIFENHSDKLVLANHSLKQLNILSDNKQTGKLASVSSFLNNCVTVMGKREFARMLHNPTTNITWLQASYDITEYALQNNSWDTLRGNLLGVNDIEKFSRKLVMKKVNLKELSVFYNDIAKLLFIYNETKSDETVHKYITNSIHKNDELDYISNACNQILQHIDRSFYIERCSHIYNLNSEFLSSLTTPADFFIKPGVSLEIDQLFSDCIHSRKKLEAIRAWLSERVASMEKIKKNTKAKSKAKLKASTDALMSCLAGNQNEVIQVTPTTTEATKATNFIKIHDTPKSPPILMGTKLRITRLKEAIKSLAKTGNANSNATVTLHYNDHDGTDYEFDFSYDNLDYSTIGSNKKDVGISNKMIKELAFKTQEAERNLVVEITAFFNQFISEFTQFHDELRNIIQFTSAVDILQAKCYIANKYNYNKPNIISADKSFFAAEGIRHPLIEHIQNNELYVTNDISLGIPDSVDQESLYTEMYNGMLLYGTNAVGKTSLIKSIGIAVIMAQAGLYVPCKSFCFSPYHSIYTRILGNDNIFKGLSTFAVEMTELRTILRMADKNSLILGDELCSGTESDSALSIFTAGLEHLHDTGSTHLFATHFHEIQHFEEIKALDKLCMKHMAVTYDAEDDSLIYDRKLRDGPGESMYGLEVCKSLHLPDDFLKRAHYLRNKYNGTQQNILGQKVSHFNAKKIMGDCENCGEKGTEVHHLQHQNEANTLNYIESFHKNHKANLMTVCEKCHHMFHDSKKQHVRKKTTSGYKISAI
tara:strand:- start:14882 stop:18142 length:3261 start_codon:yes stop_codon:yes gene_type:complete